MKKYINKTVYLYYKYYNLKYFSNKLPDIEIKVKKSKGFMGEYDAYNEKMYIYYNMFLDKYDFKTTLLHEMVHVYQGIYVKDIHKKVCKFKNVSKKRWHSKEFKIFQQLFRDYGYDI